MKTEEQAKDEILKSDWNVKNVKFMQGHDGDAMSCTLYKGKKRFATAFDDSWGGEFQYDITEDKKENKELLNEFDKFAKSITAVSKYFKDGMQYNMDIVVNELVNDFEQKKQIKNMCRNKIIFKLKSKPDELWYLKPKNKITPEVIEHATNHLKNKYGSDLQEVLN